MNKEDCKRLLKYDYAGISIMIGGSITPPIYYGFMCEQMHFWLYLWLGQVWFLCLGAFLVVMVPKHVPNWQSALAFCLAGSSVTPACLHLAYYSDPLYVPHWEIWPWLTGGIIYLVGAIVYSFKVPERYFAETFDIYGASH
jgi:adiponectin receptor